MYLYMHTHNQVSIRHVRRTCGEAACSSWCLPNVCGCHVRRAPNSALSSGSIVRHPFAHTEYDKCLTTFAEKARRLTWPMDRALSCLAPNRPCCS